jgi:hypothetical protein
VIRDSSAVAGDGVEDLVAGLRPDEGLGLSFQVSIQARMSALSARTERWAPRRSFFMTEDPTGDDLPLVKTKYSSRFRTHPTPPNTY